MTAPRPAEHEAPLESRGALFPAVSAVVAREQDGYLLVGPDGMRSRIRGSICAEIEASLARGRVTEGLRRFIPAHDALAQLAEWLETPSVPLTRESAVRLDGLDTIFVELLGRCNERCVHCYADSAPTVTDALEHEVVMRIVDEAHALGFKRIQFTGGDPLLCDFLPAAVERATKHGFELVEIYTNGLALTETLVDELAVHRPSFAFSFYSIRPDVHDEITRTPGSHRRTLAAIDRAIARKLPVRVSIVVTTQDEDLNELIAFLRARGVESVGWTTTFSVGRGVELAETSKRARAANANTPPQVNEGGGHRFASTAASPMKNGKLCVTYTGDVVPCIFQRTAVLGNVNRGRSLADVLAGELPPVRARPLRALPMVDTVRERLECSSCRLTDFALDWLGGAR